MSKSKGNVLDPHVILKTFGADPLRYFLLREIPIGLDGNFSHEGFLHRVNSDLANDLGNLVQRTLTMIRSYFGDGVLDPEPESGEGPRRSATDFEALKARVVRSLRRLRPEQGPGGDLGLHRRRQQVSGGRGALEAWPRTPAGSGGWPGSSSRPRQPSAA